MKSRQRSLGQQVGSGVRALAAQLHGALSQPASVASAQAASPATAAPLVKHDVPVEFHRRMFAIISAVQVGIWDKGVQQLVGYATDFGLGQDRGVQTLVLKTRSRSAYVRLQWDTIMSDSDESRRQRADAVSSAIGELS